MCFPQLRPHTLLVLQGRLLLHLSKRWMALPFLQELRVQSYLPQNLQEESLAVEWKVPMAKAM